jgi:hypothetical protein
VLAGELMFGKEHCCLRNKSHFRNHPIVPIRNAFGEAGTCRSKQPHGTGIGRLNLPVMTPSMMSGFQNANLPTPDQVRGGHEMELLSCVLLN